MTTISDTAARRRLIACRAVRSIGQGLLVVDFPLYLDALGWNAVQIGGLFTAVAVFQAALTLFSGPLSDHYGRRIFLLGYEIALLCAAMLALASSATWAITAAALAAGFGRGMNGAAGPFSPVEQAWLAHVTPGRRRGFTFSVNTSLGSSGMAVGALLAALPALWAGSLPGALAYRPMFALVLVAAMAPLWILLALDDPPAKVDTPSPEAKQQRQEENRRMFHIAALNVVNGAAIGLIAPLMTYWFLLKFGVGPAHIGPVLAISFAVSAIAALVAGKLTHAGRVVKTVVWMRAAAVVLLVALPLAPTFLIASILYIGRSALNRGTIGARQALNMNLVSDQRRGLTATLSSLAVQLPRSAGPAITGVVFAAGFLGAPFFAAAGLQAVYLLLFRHIFGNYEKGLPEIHKPP